ncbi:DUF397 domain-containing protein [Streptosporangium lutulentum]|uniref:DUF397 domain-containing protein n=1 Tax=Streptosporangium lutulentum TaxID=1461250 RepID=UPI00352076D3
MDLSAAVWRKSSRSGSNGGQCVEVATNLPGAVAVRDSKDPGGPKLLLTPAGWQSFVGGVKAGDFDRLSRLSQLGKFRPSLNRSTTPSFFIFHPRSDNRSGVLCVRNGADRFWDRSFGIPGSCDVIWDNLQGFVESGVMSVRVHE